MEYGSSPDSWGWEIIYPEYVVLLMTLSSIIELTFLLYSQQKLRYEGRLWATATASDLFLKLRL